MATEGKAGMASTVLLVETRLGTLREAVAARAEAEMGK